MSSGPVSTSMLCANLLTMSSRSSPCTYGIPSISKLYFLVHCSRSLRSEFIAWIFFFQSIHSSLDLLEVLFPCYLSFLVVQSLFVSIAPILVCRAELLEERSSILACENSRVVQSSS